MANDKSLKVKNGLSAKRYMQGAGTATGSTSTTGYAVVDATYDSVFTSNSIHNNDTDSRKFFFKDDGTKVFIIGNGSGKIWEYPLSTAYDVSTIGTSAANTSVTYYGANSRGGFFKPDGTRFYSANLTDDEVGEYILSTAWDVSTMSPQTPIANYVISLSANVTSLDDVEFSSDGTKMIVTDIGAAPRLKTFDLSTAWDVTTATYNSSKTYNTTFSIAGIRFSPDGLTLYIVGSSTNKIHIATLTTAYDISTITSVTDSASSFDSTSENAQPEAIDFNSNGTKMYILGTTSNDNIYQYTSGATNYSQTIDLSTGHYFSVTMSNPTTFSFTNPPASGVATSFVIELNNNESAITWPSSVKWAGGEAPAATSTKDIYKFITTDGGTTYYGALSGGAMA